MSKIAVVTGGTSGIGKRTVERLIESGWTVWSLSRSEQALKEQEAELNAGGNYGFAVCDVGDPASVQRAFDRIRMRTDSIDALICSAGANISASLEDMTPEQADLLIGVNFKGPWLCVKEALPLLRKNTSQDDPARVLIIGSIGGMRPKAGAGMYSATKAAVHVLTGILAVELAASGVTVNSVAPGTTRTPMIEASRKAAEAGKSPFFGLSGASPLGRIGEADDVVDVIEFFLSDAARYVNGAILPVDGGTRAAYVAPAAPK
jgi:NAD(P)-dependent dehydrogenase (short-subunit alcohol dehydrogenase family)